MTNKGGRPFGAKDKGKRITAAVKMMAYQERRAKLTPLDVMLATMEKAWNGAEKLESSLGLEPDQAIVNVITKLREEANAAAWRAAPYIHPRLSAVAFQTPRAPNKFDTSKLSSDQKHQMLQILRLGLIETADNSDGLEIEGSAETEGS